MPSGFTISANFTRPADVIAYTANDLVANSVTAGSVVPLSWALDGALNFASLIRRARLKKSSVTTAAASFRLHLYSASPVSGVGDNVAWLTPESGYLGSIDLDISGTSGRVFSDGAKVVNTLGATNEIMVKGATVYGLLQALGAYAPASAEVFTVELEVQTLNPK